jgi:inorganic pyrophosphatase
MSYSVELRGTKYTETFSAFIKDSEGNYVSPFHDIPTWADEAAGIVNMVVEVPRWSNAKMEITKDHKLNPIRQDTKKGKMRFVKNCFPHHGYIWNYGAIPQTWENPDVADEHTGENGDNDPVDICELGSRVIPLGEVVQVKLLGVLAMIDDGETDWKLLGIDINDPMADKLNDIVDLEEHMRGYLSATVEWFKIYKIPDGKPENQFAFDGEAKDKAFAINIVNETHAQWKKLASGEASNAEVDMTSTIEGCGKVSGEDAKAIVAATPEATADAPLSDDVDKWYYIRV